MRANHGIPVALAVCVFPVYVKDEIASRRLLTSARRSGFRLLVAPKLALERTARMDILLVMFQP